MDLREHNILHSFKYVVLVCSNAEYATVEQTESFKQDIAIRCQEVLNASLKDISREANLNYVVYCVEILTRNVKDI